MKSILKRFHHKHLLLAAIIVLMISIVLSLISALAAKSADVTSGDVALATDDPITTLAIATQIIGLLLAAGGFALQTNLRTKLPSRRTKKTK